MLQDHLKNGVLLAAVAVGMFALSNPSAFAAGWARHGIAFTPHGAYRGTVAGSCGGGSCSRERTVTGPNGHSVTSSGTVTRTAPGDISSSRTITGPNGRTVTRSGSTDCANGSCTHSMTVTGPNGESVSHSGTVTRVAPGEVATSGTITGPNGNTISRTGQTDCGGYACVRTGTVTGPEGGTVNTAGAWWR